MPDEVVIEAGSEGAETPPPGATIVEPKGKSALDRALEKTQTVFGGHPSASTDLVDDEDGTGEEEAAAGTGEGEEGEEEGKGQAPQPPKGGKKPDKPAKPRGKTIEEEAELRANAERWGHELGREVKDLKAENAGLVARLEALEKKGQGDETPPASGKKAGEEATGPVAAAKDRIRELLVQIDELDQFDPDYYEKKAELMSQLYGKGGSVSEEELAKLVAKAVKEQKTKDEDAKTEEERSQAAAKKVVSLAKKLGLDMREAIGKDDSGDSYNSLDWDLFWDVSVRAPKGITLEEQVKWCAKEVKRMKTVARKQITQEAEEAAAHHRDTAILGRHGEGRIPAGDKTRRAPTQNLTLQDALNRSQRVV